jgi:arylsulfatase A-like enzyme
MAIAAASTPAFGQDAAATGERPNILFIMADDVAYMQPSIYHRGPMVGETPNRDRLGAEGALFTDQYTEQSCTAGRNAFLIGMHPLRTGMIPPQLPGSPSYFRPGTQTLSKFLCDLGYSTGEFGKNHVGDHDRTCAARWPDPAAGLAGPCLAPVATAIAPSSCPPRQSDTPPVPTARTGPREARQPRTSRRASLFFKALPSSPPNRAFVRPAAASAWVFVLKRLKPPGLGHSHPGILRLPG